eukprot:m.220135 g.220135  ORF g.220135 m.220135 type:complete len:1723 (+) comp13827_c0_seq6:16-5184(+)
MSSLGMDCVWLLILAMFLCFTPSASQQQQQQNQDVTCANGFPTSGEVLVDSVGEERILSYQCSSQTELLTVDCGEVDGSDCSAFLCASRCTCMDENKVIHCRGSELLWPEGLPIDMEALTWTTDVSDSDGSNIVKYSLSSAHFRPNNRITHLTLHNTQMRQILPDAFSGLTSLKELEIVDEPLLFIPWGSLPQTIANLTVQGSSLDGVVSTDLFANLSSLEQVTVSNSNVVQFRAIARDPDTVLSPSLTSLRLFNNGLRSVFALALGYPNVRVIDISNNKIPSLSNSMFHPGTKVVQLDASNNNIRYIPFGFYHFNIENTDVSRVNLNGNPSNCTTGSVMHGNKSYTTIECACEFIDRNIPVVESNYPYCSPPISVANLCGLERDISKLCNGFPDCPGGVDEVDYLCKRGTNVGRSNKQFPPNCFENKLSLPQNASLHTLFYFSHGIFNLIIYDKVTSEEYASARFVMEELGERLGLFSFRASAAGYFYGLEGYEEVPVMAKLYGRVPEGLVRLYWDPDNLTDVCDYAFGQLIDRSEVTDEWFDFPHPAFEMDPGLSNLGTTAPLFSSSTVPSEGSKKGNTEGAVIGGVLACLVVAIGLGVYVFYRHNSKGAQSYHSEQTTHLLQLTDNRANSQFASEYKTLYDSTPNRIQNNAIVPSSCILISSSSKQKLLGFGTFGENIVAGTFTRGFTTTSAVSEPTQGSAQSTQMLLADEHDPREKQNDMTSSNVQRSSPNNNSLQISVSKTLDVIVHTLDRRDENGNEVDDAVMVQFLMFARVLLALSRHPNILKVEAFSIDSFPLKIATESLTGGTLYDILHDRAKNWKATKNTKQQEKTKLSKQAASRFANLNMNLIGNGEESDEDESKEGDMTKQMFNFDDIGTNDVGDEVNGEMNFGNHDGDYLSKAKLLQILHKVASAMTFVESKGVVHRSLSLANIILSDSLEDVRVTGFSLASSVFKSDLYLERQFLSPALVNSKHPSRSIPPLFKKNRNRIQGMDNDILNINSNNSISLINNPAYKGYQTQRGGDATLSSPLRYCAPEVLEDGDFSSKTDVFAFGVVMLETLHLGVPFMEGVPAHELLGEMNNPDKMTVDVAGHVAEPEKNMIEQCISIQPANRPTFSKLHALLSYTLSSSSSLTNTRTHESIDLNESESNSNHEPVFARSMTVINKFSNEVTSHGRLSDIDILDDSFVCSGQCRQRPLLFLVRKTIPEQLGRDEIILANAGVPQILGPVLKHPVMLDVPRDNGKLPGLVFVPPRFTLLEAVQGVRKTSEVSYTLTWLLDLCLALERMVVLRCNSSYLNEGKYLFVSEQRRRLCLLCIPAVVLASDAFVIDYGAASIRTFFVVLNLVSRTLHSTSKSLGKRFEADVDEIRRLDATTEDPISLLCRIILHLKAKSSGGLEVSWSDLEFVKLLGSGQFGEVQLMRVKEPPRRRFSKTGGSNTASGRKLTAGLMVAVKTLLDPACEGEFAKEMQLMTKIHHSNLLTLQHIITAETPKALVIEYLPNGSLDEWLKLPTSHPTLQDIIFILYQIACGCAELERIGIVHRDIAARNVLLGFNLEAKLSDYGLSRQMTTSGEDSSQYYSVSQSQALPVRWMPPEVLTTRKFDTKSDVYAYGMLIYEVVSDGQLPFPDATDEEVVNFLLRVAKEIKADDTSWTNKHLLEPPPHCNTALANLFYSATKPRPTQRANFSDIIATLSPHHFQAIEQETELSANDDEESYL